MKSELGIRPPVPSAGPPLRGSYSGSFSGALLVGYAEESPVSSGSRTHTLSRSGKAGHHSDARGLATHDRWPMAGDATLHSARGGSGDSAAQTQACVAAATTATDKSSRPRISARSAPDVVPTFSIGWLKTKDLGLFVQPYCERRASIAATDMPTCRRYGVRQALRFGVRQDDAQ